jgi:hypothetical protein
MQAMAGLDLMIPKASYYSRENQDTRKQLLLN